jgi:hypothetical protein
MCTYIGIWHRLSFAQAVFSGLFRGHIFKQKFPSSILKFFEGLEMENNGIF